MVHALQFNQYIFFGDNNWDIETPQHTDVNLKKSSFEKINGTSLTFKLYLLSEETVPATKIQSNKQ